MVYDEQLSRRLGRLIESRDDMYEQKMFGGIGYLLRGNMCFGIYKEFLILRIGEAAALKALKKKSVRPFDITGRAMKGWVMVAREGMSTDASLKQWVAQAIEFVLTLPRK